MSPAKSRAPTCDVLDRPRSSRKEGPAVFGCPDVRVVQITRLEDRVKDESGAAEEDEADEAGGAVKAVGTAGDGSDLAVEALDAAVAETGGDEGEDAFEVAADGSRDPFEGL